MQNLFSNTNFLKRLLTAVIAIPLALLFIIETSPVTLLIISLAIFGLCFYEWVKLFNLSALMSFITIIINLLMVYSLIIFSKDAHFFRQLLLAMQAFWMCATITIIIYQRKLYKSQYKLLESLNNNKLIKVFFSFLLGMLVIAPGFVCLNYLKALNSESYILIIVLLILVWAIDTGSYFSGRLLGKRKLISNVSPGKTIEGAIGGLFFLYICAVILYYNFSILNNAASLTSWLILNLAIYFSAIIGDLVISMFKRIMAVKDTGNILPGHGGILDRLDSFFCAMPVFCYCLLWYGII